MPSTVPAQLAAAPSIDCIFTPAHAGPAKGPEQKSTPSQPATLITSRARIVPSALRLARISLPVRIHLGSVLVGAANSLFLAACEFATTTLTLFETKSRRFMSAFGSLVLFCKY